MGFGKDKKGVILRDVFGGAIGALNAGSAVKFGVTVLEEDFRMLKAEIMAAIVGLTTEQAECLILGIASNELTDLEIEECIKARVVNRDDRLEDEKVTRPVFPIAMQGPSTGFTGNEVTYNDNGKPHVCKKPWTYSNADGFCLFIYNAGSINLTTGATIRGIGTYYGVWLQ